MQLDSFDFAGPGQHGLEPYARGLGQGRSGSFSSEHPSSFHQISRHQPQHHCNPFCALTFRSVLKTFRLRALVPSPEKFLRSTSKTWEFLTLWSAIRKEENYLANAARPSSPKPELPWQKDSMSFFAAGSSSQTERAIKQKMWSKRSWKDWMNWSLSNGVDW